MQSLHKITQSLLALAGFVILSSIAFAADPGNPFPETSQVNDQKPGSVLVYNAYTSDTTAPIRANTVIAITNTNASSCIGVHLFFVDGNSCSVADSLLSLTPNQTARFLTSDIDPGVTGYIMAVAVNPDTGCPINFNFLIGDEYVKFSTGHAANLSAEAFAAVATVPTNCDALSSTARLSFDGISYNRVPRVLALDNIGSRANGNDTLLIINRIGGNLATGAATLGAIFGIFYDDAETALSFSFTPGTCQFRSSISNNFPRIAPRFEQFVPAGRTGWLKLSSSTDAGILGAAINLNLNAGGSAGAFNQGHNLHKYTLAVATDCLIPVANDPNACPITIPFPRLEIEPTGATVSGGFCRLSDGKLVVIVNNRGNAGAANFEVRVKFEGEVITQSITVGFLAPGKGVNLEFDVRPTCTTSVGCNFTITIVDDGVVVREAMGKCVSGR